jgi:hypothetical protein
LNPDKFDELLNEYGSHLRTWPWRLRRSAVDCLKHSRACRQMLAEFRALERALGPIEGANDVSALTDRIVLAARRSETAPGRAVRAHESQPAMEPRLWPSYALAAGGGALIGGAFTVVLLRWSVAVSDPILSGVTGLF